MSDASTLVNELWSYCNVLRDDGLSYGDYTEQLTYLLFLKMADEYTRPPWKRPSPVPEGYDWPALLHLDGDALDDGSRVDVEMQIRTHPALTSRLVYYGARDYADQLSRGDDYQRLTPTVVIAWLVDPLFPTLDRLHSIFELRERHTHTLFSDHLAIHLLQLPRPSSLSQSFATGCDVQVERWARFLTARDDAELDQLAAEDPIMNLAKQTLDQLSQDPAIRRLARERADAIKLYEMDLYATRADAEARGEAKGRASLLLKLLDLRFGQPSEATRARVEAATPEQLDAWAERVLTAQTLAEILAP